MPRKPNETAALEATMAQHREGWKAYNRAQAALREAKKKRAAQGPHKKAMEANREAQRIYWRAYTRLRRIRREAQQDAS